MEAAGFINIAPVDNHEAMVAPSSALGWQLALEGYKPMRLRTEGRVRRQRSQDVGNTLRAGVWPRLYETRAHGSQSRGYTLSADRSERRLRR